MAKCFYSQYLGFLILVTPEPIMLENRIRTEEPSVNIITVGGLPPEVENKREEILRLVRAKKSNHSHKIFGEEFKISTEIFHKELVSYLDCRNSPRDLRLNWNLLNACSSENDKNASDEHSALKAFTWLYEWNMYDRKKIPELEATNRKIDVKMDDKNYEAETLKGIGDVTAKLRDKMKKYHPGEKVYFVLKNLDILRNLSILLTFKRDCTEQGYYVEIYGLDFDTRKFVPLNEFVKIISK